MSSFCKCHLDIKATNDPNATYPNLISPCPFLPALTFLLAMALADLLNFVFRQGGLTQPTKVRPGRRSLRQSASGRGPMTPWTCPTTTRPLRRRRQEHHVVIRFYGGTAGSSTVQGLGSCFYIWQSLTQTTTTGVMRRPCI